VNNHLEPAHDAAVRAAAEGLSGACVASPLRRRWAKTLGDEFLSGACHAGRYETSLVLAAGGRVSDEHRALPPLGISLSDAIRDGQSRFRDIGMDRAYTGAPADASRDEGDGLYEKLVAMIVGEVAPD
jgi:creatinine amidohydrolase